MISTYCQLRSVFVCRCFRVSELVYCGRKLKDELTLESYGVLPGSTVHILKKCWPEPEGHPG